MENAASNHGAGAIGSKAGFNAVNPHCLAHIVELSDTHEVIAGENINDERGIKLWAKGSPVSRELHDKLLRRSLARPLESSLSVEHGASMESIVAEALARIDDNPVFAALSGSSDARGLLRDMQKLRLPGPVKLLLTSARENQKGTYTRSLATMIVCAGLASRLKLDTQDASILIAAALMHDIGEMYLNPDYLDAAKHIPPAEWKHVASHPCVGHAFVREFTTFPSAVAACVLHHHERLDGSGYPFQLRFGAVERLSAVLAVADCVSAITANTSQGVRVRLEVALRIVPEEYDRNAAAAVNVALREIQAESCQEGKGHCLGRIVPVLKQLTRAMATAESLVATSHAAATTANGDYVLTVLGSIEKSLRATGIFEPSQLAVMERDDDVMGEVCLIVREVSWRLRNLSRNVYLRAENNGVAEDLAGVSDLIAQLDPLAQATA